MKRLNEVSIAEMEKNCNLQILESDLMTVKKLEKGEEEFFKEYEEFKKRNKHKHLDERDMATQFLIEHEEEIDKGKVLLITLAKYLEGQKALNNINHPLHNIYMRKKKNIEKALEKTEAMAREILSDKNIVISQVVKKPENIHCIVQVLMSKELIDKTHISGERRRERESRKVIHTLPNKALLMAVLIANEKEMADKDIYIVPRLGIDIVSATFENAELEGILAHDEIEEFKNSPKKYSTNYIINKMQPVAKKSFEGIEKFIDIDKMCLTACVEIMEASRSGNFIFTDGKWEKKNENHEKDAYFSIEKYLADYYAMIKDKDVEIVFCGKTYTTEDVKKAMVDYIDGRYMSCPFIVNQIELIMFGDKKISDLTEKQLQRIRQVLIEGKGNMIREDLKRMIEVGLLDETTILKLYESRKIDLDAIHEVKKMLQLENKITPEFILQQFDKLMTVEEKDKQDEKETIKRYMELYKELYVTEKSEEEIEKAGKELIEKLAKTKKEENKRAEVQKQEGLLRYGLISERTYGILVSKGMIKIEDFMSMYQADVISLKTIEQLKEEGIHFDNFDIEAYIIDSYIKIREEKNPDDKELKKYIALYKDLTLKELSEKEIKEKADDLVMNIGTRIESDIEDGKQIKAFGKEDRKSLYDLEAIPIDTVVDWADKGELIELLKSEFLVPKDMRKLYQENSITLQDIQEIIESQDVKLEQKIGIINIVFPSPEDAETRDILFGNITEIDETVGSEKESAHREVKHSGAKPKYCKHIFDTAVRYNSWIQSDENVKMEILNDGHIAVHLPNVKEGIVVVEQFYKLKKAKDGKRKMDDAWGVGGYILTEDAYQENKDRFITKDNRVDRKQLEKVVKEFKLMLEEKGISGRLRHFQNYPEVVQKLIGIPKDLAKAKTKQEREEAINILEDSKQYTSEEMKRIKGVSKVWQRVRESRKAYEK